MILDKIHTPTDLKTLKIEELKVLCEELKDFVNNSTSAKAAHKNASITVTELSVALHYVFNTPKDILIWDVGHQAYIHKVLTARREVFHTNRKKNGLAGFTKRTESVYDPFGAGHSSTSISAASGFALADKMRGGTRKHIAVIGDGALTGGMSFEALNYLGEKGGDVLIILNDNESSIDSNVGALNKGHSYQQFFESLGIFYCGEIDGHNVENLTKKLDEVKGLEVPRVLVVKTKKPPQSKTTGSSAGVPQKFQEVFSETVLQLMENNDKIVAITPAMLSGSGLDQVQQHFPERVLDVGIAEQHAVTMAAGLAADGFIPIVHLYSTFSQRAFDQIIHDVALQNLHVIFCLDRAGLVGEDGPTHHGNFDPGFLNTIPNMRIAAPMDGNQLQRLLKDAVTAAGPWAIRYPKSTCGFEPERTVGNLKRAQLLKEGNEKAILSFGAIGVAVEEALANSEWAHYNFPFLKPLDQESLQEIAAEFETIFTVEENSPRGGFGDAVRAFFTSADIDQKVKSLSLPDVFIEHASRAELLKQCGLDPESIRDFVDRA